MVDIHSHILPFVDDGAEDFDDFIQMADVAVRSGVEIIVSTPHSNQKGRFENYESHALKNVYEEAERILDFYDIPLTILRGMEIYLQDSRWMDKIVDGKLIPLNNTKNYLVEFPFHEYPDRMEKQIVRMLSLKKVPVIAHPERYFCIQDDPEIIRYFMDMGCYIQINKGSVFDSFGRNAGRASEKQDAVAFS